MSKVEKRAGKYRVRVSYNDNGKRRWKSITADTSREARARAYEFERKMADANGAKSGYLLKDAAAAMISSMGGVYSPTTIRSDEKNLRLYISGDVIGDIPIVIIDQPDIQTWVSRMAGKGLSRKTIKNAYSIISRTLAANGIDRQFKVKLPPPKKFKPHTPTVKELQELLDYLRDTDMDLYIAVALSATTTMRRGEICALTAEDVSDIGISVTKSMKREARGCGWVIANTKTPESVRMVRTMPGWLRDALPNEGRLVPLNPDQLTTKFERAVKAAGLPPFRFQDLRAFAASYMISIGVSAVTVKQAGGWTNMETPNRYYLRSIEELEDAQIASARQSFERNFGHTLVTDDL